MNTELGKVLANIKLSDPCTLDTLAEYLITNTLLKSYKEVHTEQEKLEKIITERDQIELNAKTCLTEIEELNIKIQQLEADLDFWISFEQITLKAQTIFEYEKLLEGKKEQLGNMLEVMKNLFTKVNNKSCELLIKPEAELSSTEQFITLLQDIFAIDNAAQKQHTEDIKFAQRVLSKCKESYKEVIDTFPVSSIDLLKKKTEETDGKVKSCIKKQKNLDQDVAQIQKIKEINQYQLECAEIIKSIEVLNTEFQELSSSTINALDELKQYLNQQSEDAINLATTIKTDIFEGEEPSKDKIVSFSTQITQMIEAYQKEKDALTKNVNLYLEKANRKRMDEITSTMNENADKIDKIHRKVLKKTKKIKSEFRTLITPLDITRFNEIIKAVEEQWTIIEEKREKITSEIKKTDNDVFTVLKNDIQVEILLKKIKELSLDKSK